MREPSLTGHGLLDSFLKEGAYGVMGLCCVFPPQQSAKELSDSCGGMLESETCPSVHKTEVIDRYPPVGGSDTKCNEAKSALLKCPTQGRQATDLSESGYLHLPGDVPCRLIKNYNR